jgi:DNA repair photolyase
LGSRGRDTLGELYVPKGLAFETAKAVLQTDGVFACNVGFGCPNGCRYPCYISKVIHKSPEACKEVRLPKKSPIVLIREQMRRAESHVKGYRESGVFLSFLTDPFLQEVQAWDEKTEDLLYYLAHEFGFRTATLSKVRVPGISGVRAGMTLVSLDEEFWKTFEPNTIPPDERIFQLYGRKRDFGDFVWVSMEPYPPSAIHKQDFESLLKSLKFVDLIVFGKWNYDRRANTEEAREEYKQLISTLIEFTRHYGIRVHVKSDTYKWAFESRKEEDPYEYLDPELV